MSEKIEAYDGLLSEGKRDLFKNQIRIIKKRLTTLSTIKNTSRNSEVKKVQIGVKRNASIAYGLGRRLSLNSINKKEEQIISNLCKMPKKDKHLLTAEIKCFMMSNHTHDSHLIAQKLSINALDKIKNNDRFCVTMNVNYTKFLMFCDLIFKKNSDSLVLIESFEQCMLQNYPPTIQMMLIYLGVFFYTVNGQYELSQKYCQKLFDIIVRFKTQQFFIIYLLLRIKIKTNLSQWQQSLSFLTKLLFFSWMYNLADLQIWCYFQLSRVYFFLQCNNKSQIFKIKSQNNSIQPKRTIYRQVSISNLILEIQSIWQGQLDFNYNQIIQQSRLILPKINRYGMDEYITDQRKLKTNIKKIVQDCKIRHVKNLLSRMGQIGMHHLQKQNFSQTNYSFGFKNNLTGKNGFVNIKTQKQLTFTQNTTINLEKTTKSGLGLLNAKSGNNFLLTHKSYNKNINMFFRTRSNQQSINKKIYYTIENSQQSWGILKEMLRNIFIQITYFNTNISV